MLQMRQVNFGNLPPSQMNWAYQEFSQRQLHPGNNHLQSLIHLSSKEKASSTDGHLAERYQHIDELQNPRKESLGSIS